MNKKTETVRPATALSWTNVTTKCWSASISAVVSAMTQSGWKKLFEMYTKMTARQGEKSKGARK